MTERQNIKWVSAKSLREPAELGANCITSPTAPPSVFTLISEPTYVADIDGLIADWVQQHYGSPVESVLSGSAVDTRPAVKLIWEALNDPDRPGDSTSVDRRISWIRYLGKLLNFDQISSTADLRYRIDRHLTGYDGRQLPDAKAIKRARKNAGLSQLELAELLGLRDHTLISKYESGKRVPPLKVLEWLKETEKVTQKDRVKGNGRTPSNPVTSIRGNEAPISPDLGKSVTSPSQLECPSAEATDTQAVTTTLGSLVPPADPIAVTPPTPDTDGSSSSTDEDSNV